MRQRCSRWHCSVIATFGDTLVSASGQTFAAFAATPLISLWLQQQLHMSPMRAGLAMLPMAATAFVVAGAFGKLLHDVSPKWTIGAGLVLVGVGTGLLTIDTESSWAALVPGFVVVGAGIGINAPALVAVGMAAVPPQQGGIAAGAVNTARQLGLALGVAVLGTVFREVADDGRPMTSARFVDGLNAASGVAAGVGIVFGVIAFGLFHRQRQVADAPASRRPSSPEHQQTQATRDQAGHPALRPGTPADPEAGVPGICRLLLR